MQIDDFYRVTNEIKAWAACMPEAIGFEIEVPTLEDIFSIVCVELNVNIEKAYSKTRDADACFARQLSHSIAVCFSRGYGSGWSLCEIGGSMGGKDHTTVLHSVKSISEMIETGYKMNKIHKIAKLFDLNIEDLIYTPKSRLNYGDIVFIEEGEVVNEFNSVKQAASHYKTSRSSIRRAIYNGYKFKRKYDVKIK